MAEVIGAISAVAGLLDLSIRLADRVVKACEDAKDLSDMILRHQSELRRIKTIVELIQEEESLQTANITQELRNMDGIARRLNSALRTISEERGTARQLLHQFARGKREQDLLGQIMDEMNRANVALGLFISVAHVGVTRATEAGLVADREVIRRMDAMVKELLGREGGLRIARLVNREDASGDGDAPELVPVTEADLLEMDKEALSDAEKEAGTQAGGGLDSAKLILMINRNYAQDQSMMINGVVGQQDWLAGSQLTITENETKDRATMFSGVFSEIPFGTAESGRMIRHY